MTSLIDMNEDTLIAQTEIAMRTVYKKSSSTCTTEKTNPFFFPDFKIMINVYILQK